MLQRYFPTEDQDVRATLRELRPLLESCIDEILDAFYAHIRAEPELRRLFASEEQLALVRRAQRAYWLDMLEDPLELSHLQRARRVGLAHQRAGLAPSVYVQAYNFFLNGVTRVLSRQAHADPEQFPRAIRALHELVLADLQIIVSVYHDAEQRLLSEERSRYRALLGQILPESIVPRLREGHADIADRHEQVTVLFADIVGFSRMASIMSPERVLRLLDRVFAAYDDLSERYGLEKIKTIGDAYMVAGGLPDATPDHARRVADMALEMQRITERLGAETGHPLQVRIGIHSGEVIAGVIGQKRFIYDLWGDTVNVASRMESHGEPGRIQLSEATREALGEGYELVQRGSIEVKGKGPMQTYFLVGKRA